MATACAICLVAFLDLHAASSKPRSLPQLIALVSRQGAAETIDPDVWKELGFTRHQPAKKVWFTAEQTPDGYGRTLYVVYESSGSDKPAALIWSAIKETVEKSVERFDVMSFCSSPHGVLEGAARGGGEGDRVWQEPLAVSSELRRRFRRERDFFLKESAGLKLNP